MFQTKTQLRARIDALVTGMEDHRNDLRKVVEHACELSDANAKQAVTILAQQSELTRLREKCEEMAAHIKRISEIPTQFSSGPLWMSEEEEDARYKYEHGDINREMLHDTLQELGLNPDITTE